MKTKTPSLEFQTKLTNINKHKQLLKLILFLGDGLVTRKMLLNISKEQGFEEFKNIEDSLKELSNPIPYIKKSRKNKTIAFAPHILEKIRIENYYLYRIPLRTARILLSSCSYNVPSLQPNPMIKRLMTAEYRYAFLLRACRQNQKKWSDIDINNLKSMNTGLGNKQSTLFFASKFCEVGEFEYTKSLILRTQKARSGNITNVAPRPFRYRVIKYCPSLLGLHQASIFFEVHKKMWTVYVLLNNNLNVKMLLNNIASALDYVNATKPSDNSVRVAMYAISQEQMKFVQQEIKKYSKELGKIYPTKLYLKSFDLFEKNFGGNVIL